jgi:hypothetical protein
MSTDDENEFLAAAVQAVRGSGPDPLDVLGWWELTPHLEDPDARAATFAVFRAQGRELGSSPALGGLLAQPFLARSTFGPGTAVAAVRRVSKRRGPIWVLVGETASRLILLDEPGRGTYVLEPDAVELDPIDVPGRLVVHEVHVDVDRHEPAVAEGDAEEAREQSAYLGRVALAEEILGAAERAVDIAVQYACDREQFGQPIGRFQAVRHLLARASTDCVAVDGVIAHALLLLNDPPIRYGEVVKALAGRNGRRACQHSLQVLGGIGFTAEHVHHHHYSRVLLLDSLLGSSAELTHDLGTWFRTSGNDPRHTTAILHAHGTP